MCMKTKYTVYHSHIEIELEKIGESNQSYQPTWEFNKLYIYMYTYIYTYNHIYVQYIYPSLIPIMNP